MKIEVSIWSGGTIFKEIVIVERFADAEKVALARNPTGRVISRKVLME